MKDDSSNRISVDEHTQLLPVRAHSERDAKRARPRAKTIVMRVLNREHTPAAPSEDQRPRTRGECGEQRPCPFVSCRHHLYLDVSPITGSIKINFPNLEPWELEHSCSLDQADLGSSTEDAIGQVLNLSHTRIGQVCESSLLKLSKVRGLK